MRSFPLSLKMACALATVLAVSDSWTPFPTLSKNTMESYMNKKLSSLKQFRRRLEIPKPHTEKQTIVFSSPVNTSLLLYGDSEQQASWPSWQGQDGNLTKFSTKENLLQSMIPSKEEILNKISDVGEKLAEVGDKIVEIKEKVEPQVKKFLTDKYNSLLSNLIPYSDTIGVPTYVLNSLKIPQNFDPRLHLIQNMLMKSSSLNSFSKMKLPSNLLSKRGGYIPQGRSDDHEILSDQDPDPVSPFRFQHFLFSPKAYGGSSARRNSMDYLSSKNSMTRGEYYDDSPYDDMGYDESESDLATAAGHHVARGHHDYSISRGDYGHGGGGYGHGGGGGGGGLSDPFTILGGLAFLTYLAMLIQQQMAAPAPAPAPGKREEDPHHPDIQSMLSLVPAVLEKLQRHNVKLPKEFSLLSKKSKGGSGRKCKFGKSCQSSRRPEPQTSMRDLGRLN